MVTYRAHNAKTDSTHGISSIGAVQGIRLESDEERRKGFFNTLVYTERGVKALEEMIRYEMELLKRGTHTRFYFRAVARDDLIAQSRIARSVEEARIPIERPLAGREGFSVVYFGATAEERAARGIDTEEYQSRIRSANRSRDPNLIGLRKRIASGMEHAEARMLGPEIAGHRVNLSQMARLLDNSSFNYDMNQSVSFLRDPNHVVFGGLDNGNIISLCMAETAQVHLSAGSFATETLTITEETNVVTNEKFRRNGIHALLSATLAAHIINTGTDVFYSESNMDHPHRISAVASQGGHFAGLLPANFRIGNEYASLAVTYMDRRAVENVAGLLGPALRQG